MESLSLEILEILSGQAEQRDSLLTSVVLRVKAWTTWVRKSPSTYNCCETLHSKMSQNIFIKYQTDQLISFLDHSWKLSQSISVKLLRWQSISFQLKLSRTPTQWVSTTSSVGCRSPLLNKELTELTEPGVLQIHISGLNSAKKSTCEPGESVVSLWGSLTSHMVPPYTDSSSVKHR